MVWGAEAKPLEDIASEPVDELLWRFEIQSDRRIQFRKLQALGFSETMVFPELTYLATELDRTEDWR
jgi:hypothetical protein